MNVRKIFSLSGLVLLTVMVAACGTGNGGTNEESGMPNPASVFCEEQGGRLEMRQESEPVVVEGEGDSPPRENAGGGSYGVCVFPDGSECEEWALFNGKCEQGMYERAEDGMGYVNILQEANLENTVALEIFELNLETSDEPYSLLLTIDDPEELQEIFTALDVNIRPGPGLLCAPIYQLYFHLADGGVEKFDYSCGESEATFLRGEQAYITGDDFMPPPLFNALMMEYVQSTWAVSINPTFEYGLDQAMTLELLETVVTESDGEPVVITAEVVSLLKTKDTNAIAAFASALNAEYSFMPSARCPNVYTLQFTFDDMTMVSFGYLCRDGGPALLRGDDGIWEGRSIEVSADFQMELESILERVENEESEDPHSSIPGPEEISDWVGLILGTEHGDQFDDYFERTDLGQLLYFGIESQDPDIAAQIVELRDSGVTVHLWGTLYSDILDYNGSQTLVTRIEVEK